MTRRNSTARFGLQWMVLAALLLLMATAPCSFAQEVTAAITGKIVDKTETYGAIRALDGVRDSKSKKRRSHDAVPTRLEAMLRLLTGGCSSDVSLSRLTTRTS